MRRRTGERTLAIWNETDFEKNLRKVLKKNFGREGGDAYMSLYVSARTVLLETCWRTFGEASQT